MGFNLDDMIGKYKDFARGYLFYAKVTSPTGIEADHPYLVSAATLPAQTIEAIPVPWQGNEYKIGSVNTFDTVELTFRADVAQQLRYDFLSWMQQIHDPVSNEHGNPADYMGQVDMTQLDGKGDGIMSYSLVNAFPSAVGEVTLGYDSKEITTFGVTFTYQYHIVESIYAGVPATEAVVS
jgi:hypothetical protein